MKLEELLNSLIERGWKPYGIEKDDISVFSYDKDRKKLSIGYMNWLSPSKGDYDWLFLSLRELVCKESNLWQFVCKNKLVEHGVYTKAKWQRSKKYDNYWNKDVLVDSPEYWIIECALRNETELENFLIEVIKL